MIKDDGYSEYNTWNYSSNIASLYKKRCRMEVAEMTCATQAVKLLRPHVNKEDTILDIGCGSGYFYHTLRKHDLPLQYYGIDASKKLIDIGKEEMPKYGLNEDRLTCLRIEDLNARADHVICMNVLSNIDNYHKPLERILKSANRTVILRESVSNTSSYKYVRDEYLDEGSDLKVYVNTYALDEWLAFIESYGYSVETIQDEYTQGHPQKVIDYMHYWTFFLCKRIK
jgi:ubiquinone/menaquinone biosynthesis C-methylase UbiE